MNIKWDVSKKPPSVESVSEGDLVLLNGYLSSSDTPYRFKCIVKGKEGEKVAAYCEALFTLFDGHWSEVLGSEVKDAHVGKLLIFDCGFIQELVRAK